jgi:hypothetical protein
MIHLLHGGYLCVGTFTLSGGGHLVRVEVRPPGGPGVFINITPDELRALVAELLDRDPTEKAFAETYRKVVLK